MTEALTLIQDKPIQTWAAGEIETAKRLMKCPNATQTEWEKLVLLSSTYNLNPLLNEIWIIPGKGVTVGLQGMIKTAIRSGQYDGIKAHIYDKEGKIWDGDGLPCYATCIVWRKACHHEFEQTAYWRDFGKQTTKEDSSWNKMPGYMLEKVAKSHALKLAFNLEGLYIPEEYGMDDKTDDAYVQDVPPVEMKNEMPKEEVKISKKYSEQEVEMIHDNFVSHNIPEEGIFQRAKIPNSPLYNGDMIDAFFKRKMEEMK